MRIKFWLVLAILFSNLYAFSGVILNDNVLSQKVIDKINATSKELFDKTQILVSVAASNTKTIEELKSLSSTMPKSYILLLLSVKSHKVELIGSSGSLALVNKEAILSPYPNEGVILPILASNKGDIYNAAVLNGYAEISDEVAKARGIELINSLGNTNKEVLNILRILIYGFICFALLYYAQRRMKRKKEFQRKNNACK